MKGRKGRNPLTDTQRRALGRPSTRDVATDKVPGLSVPVELPACPSILDEEGKLEWNRIGRFLEKTRRVSDFDLQSLTSYCISWSVYGRAIRPLLIGRQRLFGDVNGKPKPNKLEEVSRRHALIVIDVARKFGMTARTRHLDHFETGRPALPDELHALRGNPSKKHLKASVTEVLQWDVDDIKEPYWFDRTANNEWSRLVEAYRQIDIFTPMDVSVLAIACGAWSLYSKAVEQMRCEDVIAITDKGAAVEHPLSLIMRQQLDILNEIWTDYGMTPVDRRRFKSVPTTKAKATKGFKVYLGA